MDNANPGIIILMFLVRCLLPLLIMLGISYLLRRLGLIKEPPQPPPEENGSTDAAQNQTDGGLLHGKV